MFQTTNLSGFGSGAAGGACTGQTEITYNSAIGTLTEGGGLAKAIDGTTNAGAGAETASLTSTGPAYIGDDAGSGSSHSINGVKLWGSNNAGYYSGTINFNVQLYGSDSAPSNATDGTKIVDLELNHGGLNVTDALDYTSSPEWTPVAYRYNWVTLTAIGGGGGDVYYLAEYELYECT